MTNNQDSIYKKQNEPEMQRLIVAQHFTYTNAKSWVTILFFVLVVFPVAINIVLYFNLPDTISALLAFFAIIFLIIGEIIRTHIIKQKRIAAMLQQKFDSYVFNLGDLIKIDENIVAMQVEKYKKKDWHRKKDWYQKYKKAINHNEVVFYCQKENIDWTCNLSKKYCRFLVGLLLIVVVLLGAGIIVNRTSIIKLLSLALASIPFFSFMISSYKKITNDNYELKELKKTADEINNSLPNIGEKELGDSIKIIQIMIYSFRQTKYLIPDWFESCYHKELQLIESIKAKQRNKNRK